MKKVILIATLLLLSASAFAGIEWKMKLVMQGQGKGADNTIVSDVFAQGGSYKQVYQSVDKENELYRKGSYLLYKSGSDTLYFVNPEEKSYFEMPLSAMFQLAGAVGKIVKIKISNPVVKLEKLGTEMVLGYPCNHYKLVMDYDSEVKVVLIKAKTHEHVEKEVWSTAKVDASEIAAAFRSRDYKTGMEGLDELIEVQMKAEGQMGFPLKMVQVQTTTDKKGKSKESLRITQEVLSIAKKPLPASMFEIPADYQPRKGGLLGLGD